MRPLFPVLLVAALFLLSGCATTPQYLERNSEALSRSVYATGDSLILGRVELAKTYNEAAQKLVSPPKQRIPIAPARAGTNSVVTLPETYAGLHSVAAGSEDYKALTRANDENKLLSDHLAEVEIERQKQFEIHNQLLKDYQSATIQIANQGKALAQKTLHIVILYIVICAILALIGLGIYMKALIPMRVW